MGKRKKRLTMTKYAKKYATIRANIAKLKGETVKDEIPNTRQDTLLSTPTQAKAEVPAEVVSLVAETKKTILAESAEETAVKPVKIIVEKPEPVETVEEITTRTLETKSKAKTKPRTSARKTGKRTVATRPRAKAKSTSRN